MLETFTINTFSDCVGQRFTVRLNESDAIEMELIRVVDLTSRFYPSGIAKSTKRTPFSIHFLGPGKPIIPQRTYNIEHAAIGVFELFIVPVGPEPGLEGIVYEAVFS